ncbi:MAG: class I SAM-dependent methyltransferase [Thermoproteales archaeon]|nr:class I SAM-dependent methyltransferase [Thermoproteales archaeon]
MSTPDALEEGYKIALWKDDPWSPEGRERYNSALRKFKRLTEHPWLKNILSKEKVSLLDLGAGKGIGGVALAKTLKQHGMEVDLTMVDLRKSAVQDGLRFAHEEGVKAEAFQMNAIEAHKLGKFDIVLMYGAILTHFDSWNMPRLFASSAKSLKEDGIIVIEEFDRIHRIFTENDARKPPALVGG